MLNNLINAGDFLDLYIRFRQRGINFLLGRLKARPDERTRSTFNRIEAPSSNFWDIPAVRDRMNMLISDDANKDYATYTFERYLSCRQHLRMLSIGCGSGAGEIKFASFPCVDEILGIDLAPKPIALANSEARRLHMNNLHFRVENINETALADAAWDVVLFHSSLHHFSRLDDLLGTKIYKALKPGGLIIIHEYAGPGRFQLPAPQVDAINRSLGEIPREFRRISGTSMIKKRVYAPGRLRMYLSDPSEAARSHEILRAINKYYLKLEEKPLGGNLLMLLLKDIAHNFISSEAAGLIAKLFAREDEYLRSHASDFVFGVYRKDSHDR